MQFLRRAATALGLGLVTTVGIAWASSALPGARIAPVKSPYADILDSPDRLWRCGALLTSQFSDSVTWFELTPLASQWPDFGAYALGSNDNWRDHLKELAETSTRERPPAPYWARPPSGLPEACRSHVAVAVGFPLRTFTGDAQFNQSDARLQARGVLPLAGLDLPIRPIWPAFITSSVAWAGLWAAAINGPSFLRRRLRRWRGACSGCGYPLVGITSARCPECGGATQAGNRGQRGGPMI